MTRSAKPGLVARPSWVLAVAVLGVAPRAMAEGEPDKAQAASPATVPSAPSVPAALSAPGTPPATRAPATPSSAANATEERYHDAFARLARGDRRGAIERLRELVRWAPRHPLAGRARRLLQQLASDSAEAPIAPAPPAPAGSQTAASGRGAVSHPRDTDEQPSGAARAELTLFQTLHGAVLGAEICAVSECEGARSWVLSLMLGAGAGFGVSFAASDGGVRPGLARALSDGTLFGAANGLWVRLLADEDDSSSVAGYLALGQLAGLGIGGLLYDQLRPTTGQVSLAASGGLWLPIASAELAGALGGDFDAQGWGALMLATMNVGLAAGGWLASEVPTTASRALLIDGGGVLGTLSGLGLGVLVQGDGGDTEPTLALGFAGTVGGLALAYWLTRSWDVPDESAIGAMHFSAVPLADGGLSAVIGGSW